MKFLKNWFCQCVFILWGILCTASSSETPILYCEFIEVDVEKLEKAWNIKLSSKVNQSRMWISACSLHPYANTTNGKELQLFLEKKLVMTLLLSSVL